MKYPKLWGGPDAIGEAKLRGIQALDVPFLSASGPGFEASTKGGFPEVVSFGETETPVEDVIFASGYSESDTTHLRSSPFPAQVGFRYPPPDVLPWLPMGNRKWFYVSESGLSTGTFTLSWTDTTGAARTYQKEAASGTVTVKVGDRYSSTDFTVSSCLVFYYDPSGYLAWVSTTANDFAAFGRTSETGYTVLLSYTYIGAADEFGMNVARPAMRWVNAAGEDSGLIELPDRTDAGLHHHSACLACVTAPGCALLIGCQFFTPGGYSGSTLDSSGGIYVYKVSSFGGTIARSQPFTNLESLLPAYPDAVDPQGSGPKYPPADYECDYNISLMAFVSYSKMAVVADDVILLLACYIAEGEQAQTHRFIVLDADGAVQSDSAFSYPVDSSTAHVFVTECMVPIGDGKALVLASRGYTGSTRPMFWYLADASGMTQITPTGFPSVAQYNGHFGQPAVIWPYQSSDSQGLIVIPVWSGTGYEMYASRDAGASWAKMATLCTADEYESMESSDTGYRYHYLWYLGTREIPQPLDIVIPKRLEG